MPGSGATSHHAWPVPASTDEVRQVRDHIVGLGDAIDAEVPKIEYGTAMPTVTGSERDGDMYLQYAP
jgi:hypothetical protein